MTADLRSAGRGGPGSSRREFLEGLALTGVATLALAGGVALSACGGPDPLERALRGFYQDRRSAGAVGAEVLALEPKSVRPGEWIARVARGRELELLELARQGPQLLDEAIRAQHHEDFAHGRVRVVRGWVLSETEAALLALAALR